LKGKTVPRYTVSGCRAGRNQDARKCLEKWKRGIALGQKIC